MSHPAAVAIATAHPGAVPDLVRRLAPSTCRQRASQLRRFAEWLDGPGAGAASLADAVDAYAESRFRAGASVATVAGDLGAIRWYAGASGIEAAAGVDGARPPRSDGRPRTRWPGAPPATGRRRGSGTPRWSPSPRTCARGCRKSPRSGCAT